MSDVTWARLRTFMTVAETGSIRGAAEQLHVTEPAVSAAVGSIERQLGVELLSRHGRGIRLTESGLTYARYCRALLGLSDEAAAAVRTPTVGRLRIGAVATAGETVLPRLLAGFRDRYPEVDLSLSVRPRDELFAELERHEIDLAIAGRPPRGSDLISVATRPNGLVVVAGVGYDREPATATWLLRGQGSGTRSTCLALFEQRQWQPPTLTLGTLGAVLAAARERLGLTLVHADAVASALRDGSLHVVPVPGTPLDRPWHLVTNRTPQPAARLFVEDVCAAETGTDLRFHPHNQPRG
ncbi:MULTISPECIES: LysR family transcriptional regulator [unclassified Nocardioides]|uniref:LysR family transcriptional regulator n=1 Tax=unclassified Nocardioides TaxID=2615069 RepID=UPI0006FEDA6B|nr:MULTISPECIES: LysR substrate-binding domain-containing protein [unclassified Nocardioides]KRA27989.1 transcriptional regulator [Nocardioides sp. Root614]KRA85963.1 transcriptional regulator [Nocardioides sp. Root682]